jgi:hypothetical protein
VTDVRYGSGLEIGVKDDTVGVIILSDQGNLAVFLTPTQAYSLSSALQERANEILNNDQV